MAEFKIVTPSGPVAGIGYELEMEALRPIGGEIVEVAAASEDEGAPDHQAHHRRVATLQGHHPR